MPAGGALTFEMTLPGKTLLELSRIIDGLETMKR